MIEAEMQRLLYKAKFDKELREKIIRTSKSDDPIKEFCELAQSLGYDISAGELFAHGLTMNDAKLRATNGGGSFEIEGWNDLYENLLDEIISIDK